jgi:phosphatidylserine/phosphatidylglycerophosphate/cardiolipin synthase-like enzyme
VGDDRRAIARNGVAPRADAHVRRVASWIGNRELDVVVEDEQFAEQMARQYERDRPSRVTQCSHDNIGVVSVAKQRSSPAPKAKWHLIYDEMATFAVQ